MPSPDVYVSRPVFTYARSFFRDEAGNEDLHCHGGYVVAVVIAVTAVTINVAATSGPDYQASSGMLAFGDSLLFLAVFGVCEVPATGAALYFLRPYRSLWHVLACVALFIAATGIVTLVGYYLNSGLRLR